MARINNDNQENINKLKVQVEVYRNDYCSPYYTINFDDIDCERYEIQEYDELQNKIQEIYDNPQYYTEWEEIYVEYDYDNEDIENDLLGYIKGGEE